MTVYVYKEYYDLETYENERIEVFGDPLKAIEHLKEQVAKYFGKPWEKISGDDIGVWDEFGNLKVAIRRGNDTRYWMIEEKRVR